MQVFSFICWQMRPHHGSYPCSPERKGPVRFEVHKGAQSECSTGLSRVRNAGGVGTRAAVVAACLAPRARVHGERSRAARRPCSNSSRSVGGASTRMRRAWYIAYSIRNAAQSTSTAAAATLHVKRTARASIPCVAHCPPSFPGDPQSPRGAPWFKFARGGSGSLHKHRSFCA